MLSITPPNSSPLRRKRSYEDDEVDYYNTEDSMKRWQDTKIFTETHQNTVQMMINAQKNLQKLEKAGLLQTNEKHQPEQQQLDEQSNFKQAPYWPVLNKVKN